MERKSDSHRAGNYMVYIAEVVAYKEDENQVPMLWHEDKYFAVDMDKEIR